MQGPETRETLLARLSSPQSEEGWREFAAVYRPLVYRVAKAKGLQHADAEDLTQDVLALVERSLDQFDPTIGGFRSWLYQITRNLVVNHLTRRRGPLGSGDSDVARMLSQQSNVDDQTATLFRLEYRRACFQHATSIVKAEFSEATWAAFWLTAVELQPIVSVAMKLGKSEGAIRVARCRVLDRLRVFVSEQSGGFEPPD
jgi:RNA polymerase sigma factor (sigma-70 family)